MTRRILVRWFTGCLLAATAASAARAQMQDAFVDAGGSDMQLFAPVDFDFEGQPINEASGWFFGYSKVVWAATGERATVGQKGLTDTAEYIVRENALDDLPDLTPALAELNGNAPTPYTIQNGIQDGGPEANFATGDRYEFGYFAGGSGWLVGVLDGPNVVTNKAYGFTQLSIPNTLPISQNFPGPTFGSRDFNTAALTVTDGSDLANYNPTTLDGSGDIPLTANHFGSVHVNFDTPDNYLFGWRDYHVNREDNLPSETTGGPSFVATTIGRVNGVVTTIVIVRGADGEIDNLDNDLINGFGYILADIDGDGTIDDDERIATFADFDDLHRFNIRFDRLYTRNTTETNGIELMKTHELDNSHMAVKEQHNRFAIAYGARFLTIDDTFSWEGQGDVLGRSYAVTGIDNQIVGPQIRAMWSRQQGRVGFDLDGRCLFGYNIQDVSQTGGIGEGLNPGGVNSLLFAQPTFFDYGRQENFFSPVAEMRAEVNYQLTSAFALKLGYTAIFADNITRASQVVNYRLPDMGFREGEFGKQNILINGLNVGVEAVY